jgi:hypothetical protein
MYSYSSPSELLNCLFAKWARYSYISRIESVVRLIDRKAPLVINPSLKGVFRKMDCRNAPYESIGSILNAFTFFKFGTAAKGYG